MRYSLMVLSALAGLALIRPSLQVEHVVVLTERPPEDVAAPVGAKDSGQTQSTQKPTSPPKGSSTMR